eukprot:TRINITY_DN960_c0_g1_i1.p1 TRINITY_DN960_c0_g1~~TRINITY_DN960_c0_g1_i1.p1  ORF type:complete len:651 (+),score=261.06 TRINITY_DN960_c0_g1_i1:1612-3564(+)
MEQSAGSAEEPGMLSPASPAPKPSDGAAEQPSDDARLMPPPAIPTPPADARLMPPPMMARPPKPKRPEPASAAPSVVELPAASVASSSRKTEAAPAADAAAIVIPPDFQAKYKVPFWDAKPIHPYYFEVVKNGVIIERIDIHSKGHFLIGRAPVCDIVLDHPSVSRQQCIVQHRKTGAVYVYELGSTHGTKLGRKRLPAQQYIPLPPGGSLQFGASTRLFVLQGRPDDEPAEVAEPVAAASREPSGVHSSNAALASEVESAWRPKKLEQQQADNDEGEGEDDWQATEEQQAAQPKDKRPAWLSDSDDDSEDDDFYDRTAARQRKKAAAKAAAEKAAAPVYTADSLRSRLEQLEQQRQRLLDQLTDIDIAESRRTPAAAAAAATAGDDDSLGGFMKSLSTELHSDTRRRLQAELEQLQVETASVESMLRIVQPALEGLRAAKPVPRVAAAAKAAGDGVELRGSDGTTETIKAPFLQQMLNPHSQEAPTPEAAADVAATPAASAAPATPATSTPVPPAVDPLADAAPASLKPPPSFKAGLTLKPFATPAAPAAAAPTAVASPAVPAAVAASPPPAAAASATDAVRGKPASPKDAASSAAPAAKKAKTAGGAKPQQAKQAAQYEYEEDFDSSWTPPKGQDGSGRTALNAKFGY